MHYLNRRIKIMDVNTSDQHSSSSSTHKLNSPSRSPTDISPQHSTLTTPVGLATLAIDSVYVVWDEESPPGQSLVFFKRSTIAFDPNIQLSNNPKNSGDPIIAVSGNNVYVVWNEITPATREIFYKRSTDGGATFENVVKISTSAEINKDGGEVAASGNNVYVVWGEEPSGKAEILYRRSTDGGATFGSTINLSNTAGSSQAPGIVASGNNVYLVWGDDSLGKFQIFYRRSTDGGATFGSTSILSNSVEHSELPRIAASGNNVYVVWLDDAEGNSKTFYRRSTDGGASFGSTINIGNNGGMDISSIAASGNNVYVVWSDATDNPPNQKQIMYRRSTDGGATFSNTINFSNSAGLSKFPSIAASRNNVYVVWTESSHLSYRRSTDGGATFESTVILRSISGATGATGVAAVNNIIISPSLVNR
jgi:hypothetical protein